MKSVNELYEILCQAKSAEELRGIAKENNIVLTADEAAKYFAELHKTGELADDELDNVSGGCGEESDVEQKYQIGDIFSFRNGNGHISNGVSGKIISARAIRGDKYISDWEYEYERMSGGRLIGVKSTILQSKMHNNNY